MQTVEDGIIVNLLTSLVVTLLMSIEQQIPEHSLKARRIKKVEESLKDLAMLNSLTIPEPLVYAGVSIWNKCVEELQVVLENYEDGVEHEEHPELFHIDCNSVIHYTTYHYTH